jgi:Tol biopolymer transport system component/DNA-binding winged helix-turn-helix (wHTH) protein
MDVLDSPSKLRTGWDPEMEKGVHPGGNSSRALSVRFGPFELDLRERELRKAGRRIRLQEQPLQILRMLLDSPGEVVPREEIRTRLWPDDTVVEFDHSINVAMRRLRGALRDSADKPRYIQTLARRGYRFIGEVDVNATPLLQADGLQSASGSSLAPHMGREGPGPTRAPADTVVSSVGINSPIATPSVPATSRSRLLRVAARVAVPIAAAAFAFLFRPTLPPPRITSSTQLTKDGRAKATMVTDGLRIYFSYSGFVNSLYQVSKAGGDTVPFPTSFPDPIVTDISPDRSELLIASCEPIFEADCPLWLFPVLGGSPRRVGNIRASLRTRGDRGPSPDAAWSRDGKEVVYVQGNSLWQARTDGTESRKIVSVAAGETPYWPRWSPDGGRLRFSVQTRDDHSSLWEVTTDGNNLHRLLPGWTDPSFECCGSWTPDGNYFVFQSERGGSTNIWVVREGGSVFLKARHEPTQLTTGPASTYSALPSTDGKGLLVITAQVRGELVRYDSASRQLTPYLSGISAMGVNFSGDGKWVTYVAYPEGTLWRSKADGSERLQLTFPPLYVVQPRWSPDGTRIAFMGQEPGKPWSVYVIPAEGGNPEQPVPGDHRGLDPNWSPDGNALLVGRNPNKEPAGSLDLEIVDLRTHAISKVPGSQELWSPRWSRDGRHIVALPRAGNRLMLFDVKTRKWTELAKGGLGYPEWSHEGDCIYFVGIPPVGPRGMFRVRISDGKLEQLLSLRGFHQAPGWGDWSGLAADGSPLLLRDAGIQDIYALDWQAP